jgi:hypothetical protein
MASAYAYTWDDSGRTTREGRPARLVCWGGRSVTSPAAASSVVSAPIVLRFRPSLVVSSARDVAP